MGTPPPPPPSPRERSDRSIFTDHTAVRNIARWITPDSKFVVYLFGGVWVARIPRCITLAFIWAPARFRVRARVVRKRNPNGARDPTEEERCREQKRTSKKTGANSTWLCDESTYFSASSRNQRRPRPRPVVLLLLVVVQAARIERKMGERRDIFQGTSCRGKGCMKI